MMEEYWKALLTGLVLDADDSAGLWWKIPAFMIVAVGALWAIS